MRQLAHARTRVSGEPWAPSLCGVHLAANLNLHGRFQDGVDFTLSECLGFARAVFLRHSDAPAGEGVARDQLLPDGPCEYDAGGIHPNVAYCDGGALGVYQSFGPFVRLFGQQGGGTCVREVGLQFQKHPAPSIDRSCGGLGLRNPSFK